MDSSCIIRAQRARQQTTRGGLLSLRVSRSFSVKLRCQKTTVSKSHFLNFRVSNSQDGCAYKN